MELKEYQQETLAKLKKYLLALDEAAARKQKLIELDMADEDFDVPEKAWQKIQGKRDYRGFSNELGEAVPRVCLKIPTGGGKTLLATRAIDIIKTHYVKAVGTIVLWIVPSETIYSQTLKNLRNREHPYRQNLDKSSGGRTLILEKTDRFTPEQAQQYLIVMLLTLSSANREKAETLKMFQDASGFEEFFPSEDNIAANKALVERIPNITKYGNPGAPVITSLGNTLRLLKPVVIIDEGHRAYGEQAQKTIPSLNPRFILELSATPRNESNVLVTITGQALNREQMIKLDLHAINKASPDWKDTLLAAKLKLDALQAKASEYHFNTNRYIRPICLIQVERTGKGQEKLGFIHTSNVEAELKQMGVAPNAIAVKSSDRDDLKDTDLYDPSCPIRFIITKAALQEGWDCSFAYVLAVLTNSSSQTATTQLVGRILRQPDAKKTGVRELDESYVFSFRRNSNELLEAIRKGFHDEGLSDLTHYAYSDEKTEIVETHLRPQFQKLVGRIFLPRFVFEENGRRRLLSYEMDILSRIDWRKVNVKEIPTVLGTLQRTDYIHDIDAAGQARIIEQVGGNNPAAPLKVDPTFISLQLADIIPNPWMAYHIARQVLQEMEQRYPDQLERLAHDQVLIVSDTKILLERERDRLARLVFDDLIAQGKIRFVLDIKYSYLMPNSIRVTKGPPLLRDDYKPVQMSLFEQTPDADYNNPEKTVAVELDKQEQLILWWHRNYPGSGYLIKGWRKGLIYPDFVVAKRDEVDPDEFSILFVLETKGSHLSGNTDTLYKKNVLDVCNELAREWDNELKRNSQANNPHLKRIVFWLGSHEEAQSQINGLLQTPNQVQDSA